MLALCYTKLFTLALLICFGFVTYKIVIVQIFILDKLQNTNAHCKNSTFCSSGLTDNNNYYRVEKYISERKGRVQKFCDEYSDEYHNSYGVLRRLLIDRDNGITWCPVCKAGSTIWMKIFATIGNEVDLDTNYPDKNIEISKLARKAFPYMGSQSVIKALEKTTKFLIVRHPFERLLSAFRDKIEDKNKTYYYKKFGKYIMKWYRKKENKKTVPTFEEFLQYIAFEKLYDEHWRPYYRECSPCYIDYDVIMKIETYMDDQTYFLEYLGTDLIQNIMKVNHWDNTNPLGRTDDSIKREYFSQIPLALLKNIYKTYEKDFELFDYSPDEYYALAC